MRSTGASILAACLVLPSCKCADEHPYTPFRIPDTSATPLESASPPSTSSSAGTAPHEAELAPKDSNAWAIEGVPVNVAPERIIDRALAADFDGDGAKDAVAWTRLRTEPASSHVSGELVFFGGRTPAGRVVAKTPDFVPSGPNCTHEVRLAMTGSRTVTLDVSAHCSAPLVPRSPVRGIVVVAPGDDRAVVLLLRVADAAPGETFRLDVDSHDRDGDGRDDVRVTAVLKSEGNDAEAALDFAWVDRAAGASLDRAEPAHSLAALGASISDRARSKATSREVPPLVENARRLLGSLCAEWGTSRLFDRDGAPIPCGDLSRGLESLLTSEVRSAVVRRDALSAVAALHRDGWYGAALPSKARRSLEKEALAGAPRRAATTRSLDVTPRAGSGLPRWSPLAFDSDGSLLVMTTGGVSRVRLPEGPIEDASEAVDPWPLTVGSGADLRWTGVGFPCDRSELVLLVTDASGTPLPSRLTRILAPRPGLCRAGAAPPAVRLSPLEWSGTRMIGMIGASLFGIKESTELGPTVPRGAPRSADGKFIVAPSPMGLVVVGTKAETWTVDDAASLTDCVVANGASAAACVAKQHAVLVTPEPKAPAK